MASPTLTPLEYHGPGWKCEVAEVEYIVWAPNEKRAKWAAGWSAEAGERGDFKRAETLPGVLAMFPVDIRLLFAGLGMDEGE